MKKFILSILIAVFAVCLSLGIAACVPDIPDHNFDERWSGDADQHWHACTVPGCLEKSEAAPHEFDFENPISITKPATCGVAGEGDFKCLVCNIVVQKVKIEPTGEHEWYEEVTLTQEPTCGTEGYKMYTCLNCTATKSETLPATGDHVWVKEGDKDKWESSAEGHYHICAKCNQPGEVMPHTPGERETVKAPEKKVDGLDVIKCTECGYLLEEIAVLDKDVPYSYKVKLSKAGIPINFTEGNGYPKGELEIDTRYLLSITDYKDIDGNDLSSISASENTSFELYLNTRDGDQMLGFTGVGGVTFTNNNVLISPSVKEGTTLRFKLRLFTGDKEAGTKMYRGDGYIFEITVKKKS